MGDLGEHTARPEGRPPGGPQTHTPGPPGGERAGPGHYGVGGCRWRVSAQLWGECGPRTTAEKHQAGTARSWPALEKTRSPSLGPLCDPPPKRHSPWRPGKRGTADRASGHPALSTAPLHASPPHSHPTTTVRGPALCPGPAQPLLRLGYPTSLPRAPTSVLATPTGLFPAAGPQLPAQWWAHSGCSRRPALEEPLLDFRRTQAPPPQGPSAHSCPAGRGLSAAGPPLRPTRLSHSHLGRGKSRRTRSGQTIGSKNTPGAGFPRDICELCPAGVINTK